MTTSSTPGGTAPDPGIEWVRQARDRLAALAGQVEEVARVHAGDGLTGAGSGRATVEALERLRAKVVNDDFVILVAGEFNTGKSTLINALLGERVLPAYAVPTTAVLSEVSWDGAPRARLRAIDPDSRSGLARDRTEVPLAELERYVTIDDDDPAAAEKWGLAEIGWPLPLLRHGVRMVDSPGLNEEPRRSKVTQGYLARADAVLFVIDATRALASSERDFLDLHVKALGHEDMFFVCNKINQVLDLDEQNMVRQRVRRVLGTDWDAGDDRVFFVNAHAALAGRRQGDRAAVASTGIPALERALADFLHTHRARLKVVPPARHLQLVAAELREGMYRQLAMLERDLEDLQRTYQQAQAPLRRLERERELIVRQVEQHLAETGAQVRSRAERTLQEAADLCPQWASEIDRAHRISADPRKVKAQIEAAAKEVSERLGARLTEHFARWQHHELAELLTERAAALDREVDDNLQRFSDQVQELKLTFAPTASVTADTGKQPSGLERVLSTAVGWVISPGAALIGGRFGFREMVRSVLPQIALAVGAGLVGFGPVGIFLVLLGGGLASSALKLKKANDQLTAHVAGQVADEIRRTAAPQAAALAQEVAAQLRVVRDAVDEGLNARISEIHEDVQRTMAALRQGKEATDATRERLTGCLETLRTAEDELIAMITEFATRG